MKISVKLLFLFFVLTSTGFAQNYLKTDTVFTNNLDAFAGTWEYKGTSEIFRIILKKGSENTRYVVGETLIGDYFYQKEGVVLDFYVENKIPLIIADLTTGIVITATNGAVNPEKVNPNRLYMNFRDKRFNKETGSGELVFISTTKIHWKIEEDEGPVDENFIDGFSVPTDVILTKVR